MIKSNIKQILKHIVYELTMHNVASSSHKISVRVLQIFPKAEETNLVISVFVRLSEGSGKPPSKS